jgi:hypothetical protein
VSRRRARPRRGGAKPLVTKRRARRRAGDPAPVTAADLRALQRELARRMKSGSGRPPAKRGRSRRGAAPMRWNPEPEDVQKSVAQLVLTIVEFLRRLMERQAIRRMEQKTLTPKEVEAVGIALMRLEQTIRDIGKKFGLTPEDLNLDLGPAGKLM